MTARKPIRIVALAPVVMALLLGSAVCFASTITPERSAATARQRTADVEASYDRFAASDAARDRVRRGHPCMRAKAASANEARSGAITNASPRTRRCARYGLYLILLVGWYALGVAVMPWVTQRTRRH